MVTARSLFCLLVTVAEAVEYRTKPVEAAVEAVGFTQTPP